MPRKRPGRKAAVKAKTMKAMVGKGMSKKTAQKMARRAAKGC